jgi:hypothetical protein
MKREIEVSNIIIEPKNEAEALERIKTLPWAFSTREDGDKMICQWFREDREYVLDLLKAEISCHRTAGNCRHPNDPMFCSLGQVTVKRIVEKNKNGFWIYVLGGDKSLRDTIQNLVRKQSTIEEGG